MIQSECSYCKKNIKYLDSDYSHIKCDNCKQVNINKLSNLHSQNKVSILSYEDEIELLENEIVYNSKTHKITGGYLADYEEGFVLLVQTITNKSYNLFVCNDYQWFHVDTGIEFEIEKISSSKVNSVKPGSLKHLFSDINKTSFIISKSQFYNVKYFGICNAIFIDTDSLLLEHISNNNLYWTIFNPSQNKQVKYNGLNYCLNKIEPNNIKLKKEISFFNKAKEYKCPKCNEIQSIKNNIVISSFVCKKCNYKIAINTFGNAELTQKTQIPETNIGINSTCTINETVFEVISCVEKQDTHGYNWKEYCLINSNYGICFLSEYNGNWVFLEIDKKAPLVEMNSSRAIRKFIYDSNDSEFELFNDYESKVVAATGCFPGNIFNDLKYSGVEYINPPNMWAFEKPNGEGVTTFKASHISKKEIEKAFDSPLYLPTKYGVGAIEPSPYGVTVSGVIFRAVIFILFLIGAQLTSYTLKENKKVYEGNFSSTLDAGIQYYELPTFNLERNSNINYTLQSDVTNSWLEVEVVATNLNTGESFEGSLGVEYYHGYTDGETWSEGSTFKESVMYNLPKGRYQIKIRPITEQSSMSINTTTLSGIYGIQPSNGFTIQIIKDGVYWADFWTIFIFSIILLAIFGALVYSKESSRWEASPYSQYNYNYE